MPRVPRVPHRLKANHTLESPSECVWYDTETRAVRIAVNQERQVLDFGWACYRRRLRDFTWSAPKWFRFTDTQIFWDWIESLLHGRSRLYLFAHNQAFDLPVVNAFNELPARGWALRQAIIQCPPLICDWRREPHTIRALDTLNIWRMPLEKLGESIGIPKLKMPSRAASRATWNRYGKRDTEIIMEACLRWFQFLRDENLGGFAPTLASQAMRAYRRRFMNVVPFCDGNTSALHLSRAALHGGRTECFHLGKLRGPFYHLDINSMYPHVMQTCHMPFKLTGYYRHVSRNEIARWLKKYCVVARCQIVTDKPVYPVVYEDKLVFPVGNLTVTLTTPELKHALQMGHLISVESAAVYERAVLFKDFVDYFYKLRLAMRKQGDHVRDLLAKLIQNSLFGKFGQRGQHYETVARDGPTDARAWIEIDADTGQVFRSRSFGGVVQVLQGSTESRDSHPAIAAHVTAEARMILWDLMQKAGLKNVFYTDTDSLLCNRAGYNRLRSDIDPDRLGALKHEATYRSVTLHGPKDYKMGPHAKTKGVKRKAKWISSDTVEQTHFSSLVSLIRIGDMSAPITTLVRKTLKREYNKGIVRPDGKVLPLSLRHW